MTAEWLVQLQGHEFDLEDLPTWLRDAACAVERRDDGYYLTSSAFSTITDAEEVLTRANSLLDMVNSIGMLEDSGYQPVAVGHVVLVDDSGQRQQFVFLSGQITVGRGRLRGTGTVMRDGVEVVEPPRPSRVETRLGLARSDRRVAEALRYFRSPTSRWFQLYKVLEVIEQDVGGERALQATGWASRRQLTRFTHTSDSVNAIGDEARHAERGQSPPGRPMRLEEAEILIRTVLGQWLDWKMADSPPFARAAPSSP